MGGKLEPATAQTVVFLTAEYPPQPGGVGDYTHQLALALTQQGQQVAVLTGPQTSAPGQSSPSSMPGLQYPIAAWDWRCWAATRQALQSLRPAWLHIQYQTGAYGMHPAINLLPWYLRQTFPIPIVVTFHDLRQPYLLPKASFLRRWVTLRLAKDANSVITTNAEDAQALQKLGQISSTVIPIGSNIAVAPPANYQREAWRAKLGIQPNETLLVYFGLLLRSKGVDLLLEALSHCATLPLRLLLLGGAQDQAFAAEVVAQIKRLELTNRVVCTGYVDAQTVSAHLLAADLAVLPFREGCSLRSGSLLAALSHSLPVLTTFPLTQLDPQLANAALALFVPPNDSLALAEAIQRLVQEPNLRLRLGQKAKLFSRQFQWTTIAAQHSQVYRQLVTIC